MNNSLTKLDVSAHQFIDPERFAKKKQDIIKDKKSLLAAAAEYNAVHAEEIAEGTRQHTKLLTEGRAKGLSDEEIFKDNKRFIPTKFSPILNYLHFVMKEQPKEVIRVLQSNSEHDKDWNMLLEQFNTQYGHLVHDDVSQESEDQKPDMGEFLYGNLTLDIFEKIKKLKALSKSPVKEEAFLAYTKCNELCDKYNLDFDKVPCRVS